MMPTSELISVVRTMAMGLEFSCRFLVLDMCDRLERKTKDNELLAQRYLELKHRNVKTNADRIRAMTVEELANKIYWYHSGSVGIPFCQNRPECNEALERDGDIPDENCIACMVCWLQSDYEVERK